MMSVDVIGQIRRGFFEQGRPMKEIVRTLSASLAHLGDGAQLLLAAGRHLPRREPQPGRKIPRAFEVLREWRQCRNGGGGNRPDGRDLHEPARNVFLACSLLIS
jgi:hypothetical protein